MTARFENRGIRVSIPNSPTFSIPESLASTILFFFLSFKNHNMLLLSFPTLLVLYLAWSVSSKPVTPQETGVPGHQSYKRLDLDHVGETNRARHGRRGDEVVPLPQGTGPSIPKFGHGAIPKVDDDMDLKDGGHRLHDLDSRDTSFPGEPDPSPSSSAISWLSHASLSLRPSMGNLENLVIDHPRVQSTQDQVRDPPSPLSTSTISLAGPGLSPSSSMMTTTTTTTTPPPLSNSSLSLTSSSSSSSEAAAAAGCTTTIMGSLSDPCHTDGTITVHTSSVTYFRSINCGGCTAVHVVEPRWGCPLATAGMATTTAWTPYLWTSTVCEPSFVLTSAASGPSVTTVSLVTTMYENTTTTVTAEGLATTVTETEILDTVTIWTLTLTAVTSVVDETVATLTVTAWPTARNKLVSA